MLIAERAGPLVGGTGLFRFSHMTKLERLAVELHDHMWRNIGVTTDWPLQVGGDDDAVDKLIDLLNKLQNEIKQCVVEP